MILGIICFLAWFALGIYRLLSKEKIEKTSYAVIWILLMMYMLFDIIEAFVGR